MNKLMYNFLDNLYPNFVVRKTKFGNSYINNGDLFSVEDKMCAIKSICNFFSVTVFDGTVIFKSWIKTKPVYVRLENSTTDIFVPKPNVSNNRTVL